MKKAITILIIIVVVAVAAYYIFQGKSEDTLEVNEETLLEEEENNVEEEAMVEVVEDTTKSVIGASVEGRNITAYHYGEGDTELLFVGGTHGGYSWNTALVAFDLMDHLEANPDAIPANLKVTVIPVLNPDGLNKVVGTPDRFTVDDVPSSQAATIPGRFNANEVDLNRNFDCDWKAEGTWQSRKVSGGTAPFSEPESKALRDYVESKDIAGAVVWYSSAGGVYASNCHGGTMPETLTLTNIYADASGYSANEEFDFYAITGDMVNWLANREIPAISVLLSKANDVEFEQNLAGIKALFEHYSE